MARRRSGSRKSKQTRRLTRKSRAGTRTRAGTRRLIKVGQRSRHRGGCGANNNVCETTSGAATNACFPNDGLLNGPFGFIPVNSVAGIYPKQL